MAIEIVSIISKKKLNKLVILRELSMSDCHELVTVNYITSPQIENGIFVFFGDANRREIAKYALTEEYKHGYHLDGADIDEIARKLKLPSRKDAKRLSDNWAKEWGIQLKTRLMIHMKKRPLKLLRNDPQGNEIIVGFVWGDNVNFKPK